VRLLKALDPNRRVTAVPFQKSGIPASVGLTLEECEASAWAIAPDGSRYRGAEAVNALVAAARFCCEGERLWRIVLDTYPHSAWHLCDD
jgi:hypothetical protein